MTSVILPSTPSCRSAHPSQVSFGSTLTPFLGGPSQRINRLGTRWSWQFSMPPMRADVARVWIQALARAEELGAVMAIPQDIDVGDPGAPLVSAVVAGGLLLPMKGMTAGYPIRAGQYVSIIHGGRRYLHVFTEDMTVGVGGTVMAPIWPMLRTSLSVNDVAEIAAPKVEGWLDGRFEYDILTGPWAQLPDFIIAEAA